MENQAAVADKRHTSLLKEIKERIAVLRPWKVIIFGSAAKGTFTQESDIDIVVILDKPGISKDYSEILENKSEVSRVLRDIRKKVPVDLLVYTRDEWEALKKSGSSFYMEIEKEGYVLL